MRIDSFDGALFDLDGVIYLGENPVPAAPAALAKLRERGVKVAFVTNNAGLSPEKMAERIAGFGVECAPADVATSAQAIVAELARELPQGAKVLVVGSGFLRDEVARAGLAPVASADDEPAAVVQGFGKEIDQPMLLEGCLALAREIPWYVSNTDLTIPGDRGIGPGSGSFVRLMEGVTKREPTTIAGKPYPPLFHTALEKLGAEHPIFVGDRLDTDIEGAKALGIPNLWVMTGAHGKADLVGAPEERRPDAIARDVSGLLADPLTLEHDGDDAIRCAGTVARIEDGRLIVEQAENPVAALWALANLAWKHPDVDAQDALDAIDLP